MRQRLKTIATNVGPAQAARRRNISIKTLRHYEKRGLVRPQRTAAGWRVYEKAELDRLARVLSLKAMGFGLSQIAGLLDAGPEAMAAALAAQEVLLEARSKALGDALDAVRDARQRVSRSETATLVKLAA